MSCEIKDANGKVIAEIVAADTNVPMCDEGVWLTFRADDGTKPAVGLIKDQQNGPLDGAWYLAFYRDSKKANGSCDLAISFEPTGPVLQVTKGDKVAIVDLYDFVTAYQAAKTAS